MQDQRTHEPTEMDEGYDPTDISHEWLGQVINGNVQPRLDGLRIVPVHLSGPKAGRLLYVVDIPKATTTAYQASDKRYYKRFNFESVPMEHYEIMGVINRSQTPDLHVTVSLIDVHGAPVALHELQFQPEQDYSQPFYVHVSIRNKAPQPANYFALKIFLDDRLSVLQLGGFSQRPLNEQLVADGSQLSVKVLTYNLHPNLGMMPIFGDEEWILSDTPIQLAIPLAASNSSHLSIAHYTDYVLAWKMLSPGTTPYRLYVSDTYGDKCQVCMLLIPISISI